jgi:hypothetical protein
MAVVRGRDQRIEHFHFWYDRLIILKQAFDESSPQTSGQLWNDRRNPVQWFTIWLAILVFFVAVFLGLAQCILSCL